MTYKLTIKDPSKLPEIVVTVGQIIDQVQIRYNGIVIAYIDPNSLNIIGMPHRTLGRAEIELNEHTKEKLKRGVK